MAAPDVGRDKPTRRQQGQAYSGLLRDVYKDERAGAAWECRNGRVTALKLSAVGAGHARDEISTILQLRLKHRGHGPLLRSHCD
ncbi:MAG TPA: hypothetical protein VIF37_19975 [Methylobacter sp.]|jgi:hypothetical protein